ncbi:FAD-binding oxidoreductase [bacterium]|nr:MAG: FAD-binding oxidoreductase [bacterium]
MDFPAHPNLTDAYLEGFGLTNGASVRLARPTSPEGVAKAFGLARKDNRRVVLRGGGRSYGDQSLLGEALAIDVSRMKSVFNWDTAEGLLDIQAGATLEDVWRFVLEDGWFLPVTPGTSRATLAGALASNVHGKNNLLAGTLGEWVEEIEVVLPDGSLRTVSKDDSRFWGFVGGLGLLGAIVRVKLRLKRVVSGEVDTVVRQVPDWDAQFAAFEEFAKADYTVSWVDGFSSGRGIFTAGWHVPVAEASTLRAEAQGISPAIGLFSKSEAWRVLQHLTSRSDMRVLSALRYRMGGFPTVQKSKRQTLAAFHYPLDYVPDWQRSYLPGGLVQFQAAVPRDEARRVFQKQLELCQKARMEPYLVVMKRHRPDCAMLPYLVDGYSLALDLHRILSREEDLRRLYAEMAEVAIAAGGRVYLTKDALLTPDQFSRCTPKGGLTRFRELKKEIDPDGLLTSAQNERLRIATVRR